MQEEVQESEAPADEVSISPSVAAEDAVVTAPGLTGLSHTPKILCTAKVQICRASALQAKRWSLLPFSANNIMLPQ